MWSFFSPQTLPGLFDEIEATFYLYESTSPFVLTGIFGKNIFLNKVKLDVLKYFYCTYNSIILISSVGYVSQEFNANVLCKSVI
jgi:hypothetical protein